MPFKDARRKIDWLCNVQDLNVGHERSNLKEYWPGSRKDQVNNTGAVEGQTSTYWAATWTRFFSAEKNIAAQKWLSSCEQRRSSSEPCAHLGKIGINSSAGAFLATLKDAAPKSGVDPLIREFENRTVTISISNGYEGWLQVLDDRFHWELFEHLFGNGVLPRAERTETAFPTESRVDASATQLTNDWTPRFVGTDEIGLSGDYILFRADPLRNTAKTLGQLYLQAVPVSVAPNEFGLEWKDKFPDPVDNRANVATGRVSIRSDEPGRIQVFGRDDFFGDLTKFITTIKAAPSAQDGFPGFVYARSSASSAAEYYKIWLVRNTMAYAPFNFQLLSNEVDAVTEKLTKSKSKAERKKIYQASKILFPKVEALVAAGYIEAAAYLFPKREGEWDLRDNEAFCNIKLNEVATSYVNAGLL